MESDEPVAGTQIRENNTQTDTPLERQVANRVDTITAQCQMRLSKPIL
jgi:hypothetical protein